MSRTKCSMGQGFRTLLALMLISILLQPGLPVAGTFEDKEADQGDPPWWVNWSRDADSNSIDDIVEANIREGADEIDIIVDFSERPSLDAFEALSTIGTGAYIDQYIDIICVDDVDPSTIPMILGLENVVMIEDAPQLHALLDTSTRNVRVREGGTYSNTVWGNMGYNGSSVVIAIFDTGIDNHIHDSLNDLDDDAGTDDPKFVAGYDATDILNSTGDPNDIINGHGTHVAGIAMGTGGSDNATYIGVAPGALLVDVKVLSDVGVGSAADFIQGVTWVRNNKDNHNISIMSMSLGTDASSDGNDALSRAVNDAVNIDGLVAVVAVGNGGTSGGIPAPAAADAAITVGAYDDDGTIDRSDDTLATFSTRGPRADDGDLNELDELKPTVTAPGVAITSAKANSINAYVAMDGTSMAAPHVSGIVALMLEADPTLTPLMVSELLKQTAEKRGSPYDTGIDPDYSKGWGWGMVDGYGALKRTRDMKDGCDLSGPSEVLTGKQATFLLDAPFTRTRFADHEENLTFMVTVPRAWGKPEQIAWSSTGSVTHETGVGQIGESLIAWTFEAWIVYSGTTSNDKELEPSIMFKSSAPIISTESEYTLTAEWTVNEVNGTSDSFLVTVTQSSAGKPDFYLTSDDISFSPDNPTPLTPVAITAVIHNKGIAAGVANVTFYDGHPETGLLLGSDIVGVPVDGTDNATITRFITGGTHDIWVAVDPQESVVELDETNNNASAKLVVTGFNAEPSAVLEVSPTIAGIGELVTFNGNESTDTDGVVVLYHFDFGDGNTSGWVPQVIVTYNYEKEGVYIASLQVQDNGGKRSNNTEEAIITVRAVTTDTKTLYMDSNDLLVFTQPEGSDPHSIHLPNGFVEVIPGTGIGYTEEKFVGKWDSHPFVRNATINGFGEFHIWVNNTGNEVVQVDSFNFTIYHNNDPIGILLLTPADLNSHELREIKGTFSVNETRVAKGDTISGAIWCTINGDTADILYGAKNLGSGIDLTFTTFLGIPPVVDAGDDQTVNANDTVTFIGTASDEDGNIIKYMWDFESDGLFDYVDTTSGITTHVYTVPGIYSARFRAEDNDGETADDNVTITVNSINGPPVIDGYGPEGDDLTYDIGKVVTFWVETSDPDGDALSYTWSLDGDVQTIKQKSYNLNTSRMDKGLHRLEVKVTDSMFTVAQDWKFQLTKHNDPPIITNFTPLWDGFILEEGEFVLFSIDAEDPDDDTITYEWHLNGKVVGSNSDEFLFQAAESHIGNNTVSCVISDDELSDEIQWRFQVRRSNEDPSIKRVEPESGLEYLEGELIYFRVYWDEPDDDMVEFTWTSDLDGHLSSEEEFEEDTLSVGTHRITIVITDDYSGSAEKSITVIIRERPSPPKNDPNAVFSGNNLLWLFLIIAIIGGVGYLVFGGNEDSAEGDELEMRRKERARAAARAREARYKKMAKKKVVGEEDEYDEEDDEEYEDDDEEYEEEEDYDDEEYEDDYDDDEDYEEEDKPKAETGGFRM